jgi:ribosomal protein S18 acetylase RimI-like enzyme
VKEPPPPAATVRPLRRDELARAASTLATAFDEDPLFTFLLPNAPRRQTMLRWFHRSALNECFGVGGAFTLESSEKRELDGPESAVLAVIPSGLWPMPLHRTLGAIAIPRGLPSAKMVRMGLHIEMRIRALHPPTNHLYVYLLGVHPLLKGKGLGATLMRHACALAKESNCVVHLETSNAINLPFYRRFGLEVQTEIVSHGGPPVWTMTSGSTSTMPD